MATLSGGEKLKKKLEEMAAKVKNASSLNVGFLAGATYPDGTGVPFVAAMNEFGGSRSPPRPFFRRMIAKEKGHWPGDVGKLLTAHDYDAHKTLDLMGEEIKGELRGSITSLTTPALAESTIARKGFAKPLIESGHMLDSVDHEVKS